MAQHNDLGKRGEAAAARYLLGKGYTILEQNWRHKRDELDIIATDEHYLVIVEVKTRSTSYFGEPEEAVTDKKQKFMIRAAEEYVISKNILKEIRYDIISIIIKGNQQRIHHIEDAFYAENEE